MFVPPITPGICPSEIHSVFHGNFDNTHGLPIPIGGVIRCRGNYFCVNENKNAICIIGFGIYRVLTNVVFTTNNVNNYTLFTMVDDNYPIFHVYSNNKIDNTKIYGTLSQNFTVGVDCAKHEPRLAFYLEGSSEIVNLEVDVIKL